MVIRYNAPTSLTFSLCALGALLLGFATGGSSTYLLFSIHPTMNPGDPLAWLRLFGHVLGHEGWEHLLGNLAFILLLGPILEEKYGSLNVLWMILITALLTAIFHLIFSATGIGGRGTSLLGASGIVFMFILLASFTNIRNGEIPLTFIAIVAIYLSREIADALRPSNVSHFAHIIGGACGSLFGFLLRPRSTPRIRGQS